MSILVELPERLYQRDAFASFAAVAPYSLGTARAMAWMSQLAYETAHRDKIETICRLWDLRLLQIIANDNGGGSGLLKIHTRGLVVKAFVVSSRAPSDAFVTELQTFTRERLAQHEFPRLVEFVAELPKTPAGKVHRKVLRDREAAAALALTN